MTISPQTDFLLLTRYVNNIAKVKCKKYKFPIAGGMSWGSSVERIIWLIAWITRQACGVRKCVEDVGRCGESEWLDGYLKAP